jgi:UDPglucose--hexose-1-phosphate uridylyltransferase
MELRREVFHGQMLLPDRDFAPAQTSVEVRWDPLTGHAARLVRSPSPLFPPSGFDLEALAEQTEQSCPFCPDRLERQTPMFPPAVWPEGRIRSGAALGFPNLLPYAQHTAVSVYSPALHFLPLERMTPRLVADNLACQVAFCAAVARHDPAARWASVNANHMLPSGSSLFHPHLQGLAQPVPSTMQRLLAEVPTERFADYLDTERRLGARYLGGSGRVTWLAAFAPLGPYELRAFMPGVAAPAELADERDLVEELGWGIATALGLYAELGFQSFNLAIYGAPAGTAGYQLNLRMLCRSNLDAPYRSDAALLERLHWEAAVDTTPEALAERAGSRFHA